MAKIRVDIAIPAERYVDLYAGKASNIQATSREGLSVLFPGSTLNKYVTREGVYGTFDVHFDANNKLTGVTKLD